MALQVPISFKDLAVRFSEEEWRLLQEGQREFYRDVMRENYETLVSVGTSELLPLSAFLSPSGPGGATTEESHHDKGQEPPVEHGSQGGQPQQSLHLTALVQLVKEIPEFLFGEVKGAEDYSESGSTSLEGDRATPEGHGQDKNLRVSELSSGSEKVPGSWLSLVEHDRESSDCGDVKTAYQLAFSPSPNSSRGRTAPENSPLQGLINCLKEILVPGPQHRGTAPDLPPSLPGLSVLKQTRAEVEPGSLPCPVKTEPVSGDCPLQGLLNCLKEIPEAPDRRPSPSGAGDVRLQEDPGKRNSGETATMPSPLHCLESSLRGILPVRPLRFTCVTGPAPSPSPCSSSSISSSDGEDLRPEPAFWQPPLQRVVSSLPLSQPSRCCCKSDPLPLLCQAPMASA
ncbi:Protein KRBA1 [Microtus ochrogaster]|uniref:Protein KRBA1 n=1 Tax=Microtus ochrogaster TaxID=79684 RepID=A0A8J6L4H5_MICOH|nr:Protein KRBA1 [Microtus ochrogaster]